MFNAPALIESIPDIRQIYDMNERQKHEQQSAVETISRNLFLDQMDENTIARYEDILEIDRTAGDTTEVRRFRVKTKLNEKMPYTTRSIDERLKALAPLGVESVRNHDGTIDIYLAMKSKKMYEYARTIIDDMLPLNMVISFYQLACTSTYYALAAESTKVITINLPSDEGETE